MDRANVVLVTGASSGIGLACAKLLSERGHTVYGTSRKPSQPSLGFRMLELDVTQDASVQAAVSTVLAEQGHLDVVVNNAGYALAGPIEETSMEEARGQFDTNFFGVLRVCQAVLPSMRARRSGLILNVSSLGGVAGLPFQGLYSASKFALEGLTESLRLEVASFGIQVTSLQPGDVHTLITQNRVRTQRSSPASPYRHAFETVLSIIEKEERAGVSAQRVATQVLKSIERPRVGVRSSVGHLSQRIITVAKAFLPSWLFERLLKSFYGL
jgi:NAD(P)-dependent dehydrogenase (short-subunit alcohol dehydrogenase family)